MERFDRLPDDCGRERLTVRPHKSTRLRGRRSHPTMTAKLRFPASTASRRRCHRYRNGFFPTENECGTDLLHGPPCARDVEAVLSGAINLRLLQALGNAGLQRFGQAAQPPVAMPKLHEPLEIERPTRKLPEIGSFDLAHK